MQALPQQGAHLIQVQGDLLNIGDGVKIFDLHTVGAKSDLQRGQRRFVVHQIAQGSAEQAAQPLQVIDLELAFAFFALRDGALIHPQKLRDLRLVQAGLLAQRPDLLPSFLLVIMLLRVILLYHGLVIISTILFREFLTNNMALCAGGDNLPVRS